MQIDGVLRISSLALFKTISNSDQGKGRNMRVRPNRLETGPITMEIDLSLFHDYHHFYQKLGTILSFVSGYSA